MVQKEINKENTLRRVLFDDLCYGHVYVMKPPQRRNPFYRYLPDGIREEGFWKPGENPRVPFCSSMLMSFYISKEEVVIFLGTKIGVTAKWHYGTYYKFFCKRGTFYITRHNIN